MQYARFWHLVCIIIDEIKLNVSLIGTGGEGMAHTFVKVVNGYEIRYWSMGDVYYIADGLDWHMQSKSLKSIEEQAEMLPRGVL